ncbi:MAG: ATP-binding protein [Pseudomonadota bacterium]|nr:ATP-binding protein [Pseudomonadota bacterium]
MTTLHSSGELPLRTERDIVLGRQAVRRLSQEQGFSLVDQTKMVTAASELARNALIYGGGGVLIWEVLLDGIKRGLRLTFKDEGPGIANVELALTDGWTSGQGLGLGLTGARRLVNEFELDSTVGRGTRVTVTRWK